MSETVSYAALFEKAQGLAKRMETLDRNTALSALQLAAMTDNPYIQNQRVKQVSSVPVDYDKDKIAEYLKRPNQSEKPLREAGHALEIAAYPLFKLRKTYQDAMTCRSYVYPADEMDAGDENAFMREWRLADKVRTALDVGGNAHMIAGQVLLEGKVFYQARLTVDKARNRADAGCLQQIPSDWTKIVGFNSETKYTVVFNLMYFMEPGTDYRQFGDLFKPYMDIFWGYVKPVRGKEGKALYMKALNAENDGADRKPEVYIQNGRWFYWVTLPAGSVWTFEVDDATRHVFSPFTGLYTSMEQVSQYEAVQLALVQNPLISVVLGEIPYKDNGQYTEAHDPYKLSPTGREYFEALWYQMLAANNTSGVGIYSAPFENMKLVQLAEAPSANEISSRGYKYTMLKAGNGLVPMSEEPRVGSVASSQILEPAFCEGVYRTMEKLVDHVLQGLNLRYTWKLKMFGNRFTEKDEIEKCRQDMSLGILPSVFRYNAMMGHSVLDDVNMSKALDAMKINDLRKPVVSSYNQSADEQKSENGVRPKTDETTTEGKEDYEDSYGE